MNRIIFGTDGWRGLLDEELNPVNVQRVAQAFALFIQERGKRNRVAIGFDGRRNSALFARLFAEVLDGNSIEVLLSSSIVPTPVVSFITVNHHCDAGVMITASHNPHQYNGIKFKSGKGSPFFTDETATVEKLIDQSQVQSSATGIIEMDFMPLYIQHLEKLIDFKKIQSAEISVLIDSMSGAGGTVLEKLLTKHQIRATTIFGKPDPSFSGRLAEPVAKNLLPLSQYLRQGKYSVGFATDGDADRLGVMDEDGNFMNIQETILYLAQYYRQIRKIDGPIVKTASVTDKLMDLPGLDSFKIIDVQVGFKYVAEAMVNMNAAFGAEESGGFGFKEHLPERDGIFSAFIFMEMMACAGTSSLKSFMKQKRIEIGEIHYSRIDVINHHEGRFTILNWLSKNPPGKLAGFDILQNQVYFNSRGVINGLKFRLKGNPRWLLLRISETEPMVRIYAEGRSDNEVRLLLQAGRELFETPGN